MTELVKLHHEDVSHIRVFDGVEVTEENLGNLPRGTGQEVLVSKAQPWWQLPVEFAGVPNGHDGTHVFLVNDFVRSVKSHRLPPNHVWLAARTTRPGLWRTSRGAAANSQDPGFRHAPADWPTLEEAHPLQP